MQITGIIVQITVITVQITVDILQYGSVLFQMRRFGAINSERVSVPPIVLKTETSDQTGGPNEPGF